MRAEDQVVAADGPGRSWRIPDRGTMARIGFLVLHLTGFGHALGTLVFVWLLRLVVRLIMQQAALPWFIVPAGLGLIAVLAAMEVRRTVRRWRRRQPEPDVGVRVRALVYFAAACLLLNVFVVSTPESFSGPFRVRFPFEAHIITAFCYGGYLLWSRLLPLFRRRLSSRFRHGVDLIGMNVALVLVLTEVSFRVVAKFWASPLLITASSASEVRRDADRRPPGFLRFGFPMNRGGHYDTEFLPRSATQNRIVVDIGDSFSYGSVPHAYHFTTLAEHRLPGVEVYNMGFAGLGPDDYLHLLKEEALRLQPDLIVINLFVGNDVTDNPNPPGPPRWYDADRYLVAVVWHRLQIMRRAKLVDADQAATSSGAGEDLTVLYPWLTDPMLEQPLLSTDIFLDIAKLHAAALCVPNEGMYQRFFQILTEIDQAAGDVPLAFMIIPDEFQVEDDLWQEVERRNARPLDRDLPQRTIDGWLKARGLPVLDLLPALRAVQPLNDGGRHLYHVRDTHFNARGNEVTSRALAPFVDSLLSTPEARFARRQPREPEPPALTTVSLPYHLILGESPARQWMGSGWNQDELAGGRSFVWSEGVRSVLWAPVPNDRDVRMEFAVHPFGFPNSPQQRITVVLNGTEIQEVALRPGLNNYAVLLPRTVLRTGTNVLEFRYAYARVPREVLPGSPDLRTLGVAWYSIDFTPQP